MVGNVKEEVLERVAERINGSDGEEVDGESVQGMGHGV